MALEPDEVFIRDLERLCVDLTEGSDAVSVDRRAAVIGVLGQERLELALDGTLNREVGHPFRQAGSFDILKGLEGQLLVHDVGIHDPRPDPHRSDVCGDGAVR